MAKSKINWGNHFLELLVVIIGISIAFSLEGWSASKKQDKLEANYKSSLISDLKKDIEDLRQVMDSTSTIIRYTGEVFGFNYSNAPLESYKRHHITASYLSTYFYPQNGTYVSLINSGDISVIDDFELKTSLSDHYNIRYKEVERMDNVIKNLVDNSIQPFILNNIQFSIRRDGIESAKPLKTNQATNMLGSMFNLLNARQEFYNQVIEDCQSLIEKLEEKEE